MEKLVFARQVAGVPRHSPACCGRSHASCTSEPATQRISVTCGFKVLRFRKRCNNTNLGTCPAIWVVPHPPPRQGPRQAGVVGQGEVVLAPVEGARERRKVSAPYSAHLEEKRLKRRIGRNKKEDWCKPKLKD